MLKQKWGLPALAGLIVVMVVVICLLGRQGSGGGEADFFQEEPGEVEQTTAGNAEALLAKLSTEQKVGQLFLILPDALAEEPAAAGTTTLSAKELKALETYPVGGFVLTGSNIQDKDQLNKLLGRLKKTSSVTPLFALQEEGGMGATIAGKEAFGLAKTETPAALGSTGDGAKVKDAAATIGKALADLLDRPFVDCDREMEKVIGMSVADYITRYGEEAFRAEETAMLTQLGKTSGLVIATGGGCVTRPENYPRLHQNGTMIFLERELSKLPKKGRPLSLRGSLQDMYTIRLPMYRRFADVTVPNDGAPEKVAKAVEEAYERISDQRA